VSGWRLAIGFRRLANSCWQLATGDGLLASRQLQAASRQLPRSVDELQLHFVIGLDLQ